MSRAGFTLIELLVVVAIIGILATIVLVNVSKGLSKASASKAKADMAGLQEAFVTAENEGCQTISFTENGELTCVPAGSGSEKIYAKLQKAPWGIAYTIALGDTRTFVTDHVYFAINNAPTQLGYMFLANGFRGGEVSWTDPCTGEQGTSYVDDYYLCADYHGSLGFPGGDYLRVAGCNCSTSGSCQEAW